MVLGTIVLALFLSGADAGPARAAAGADCEALAAQAGRVAGLPETLLPAIARVESAYRSGKGAVAAWPWTLNEGGRGLYFKTRDEALDYLRNAVARGVRNIDVGCMQINYRWHHERFGSLQEMLDPVHNTAYAARFLSRLKARHGSWDEAAARYHSADPERGRRYLARVRRAMDDTSPRRMAVQAADPAPAVARGAMSSPGRGPLVSGLGPRDGQSDAIDLPALSPPVMPGRAGAGAPLGRDDLSPRLQAHWDRLRAIREDMAGPL
ncbi:lytic transglycosylase domain-containing protein [Rhodovulum bhavnagarense]|uniref:lytic transglycosylase domain-containing protein n=1 Tax=Rhodovulum bhavnagarense TaxID=992286 RepID=UPI003C7A483C